MPRYWKFGLASWLLLLLIGCGPYTLKPDQSVATPTVKLLKMGTDYVALMDQRYRLYFDIYNPNPFALPVESFNYHIMINGELFGRGITDGGFTIPPHESVRVSGNIIGKDLEWALPFIPEDKGQMGNFDWELYGGFIFIGQPQVLPYVSLGHLAASRPVLN